MDSNGKGGFHLLVLFQQPVDVLNLQPGARCDPLFPGSIDGLGESPLPGSHRIDDRDLTPELLLIG